MCLLQDSLTWTLWLKCLDPPNFSKISCVAQQWVSSSIFPGLPQNRKSSYYNTYLCSDVVHSTKIASEPALTSVVKHPPGVVWSQAKLALQQFTALIVRAKPKEASALELHRSSALAETQEHQHLHVQLLMFITWAIACSAGWCVLMAAWTCLGIAYFSVSTQL